LNGAPNVTLSSGSTLQVGPLGIISSDNSFALTGSSLINNGAIRSTHANDALSFNFSSINNTGTIDAASVAVTTSSWNNASLTVGARNGTFTISPGSLNLTLQGSGLVSATQGVTVGSVGSNLPAHFDCDEPHG
jgi:adhesin HecA-like repeat protein